MSKMDFLPMPVDAMFDPRLTLAHIRIMGVIAFHDRRGANGRGCFATVSTMAKEASYDTRTVKRVLADLRSWTFISSEKSKTDGRRLVHRIIYKSDLPEIGDTHAPEHDADRGHPGIRSGTYGEPFPEQNQRLAEGKQRHNQIQGEADPENRHHSYRSGAQTMPSAGRLKNARNDGAWLRMVQEELSEPFVDYGRLAALYDDLTDLLDMTAYGDELNGWAKGLQDRVVSALYDMGCFDECNGPTRVPA